MPFLQLPSASVILAAALLVHSAARMTDAQPVALPAPVLDSIPSPLRHRLQTLFDEAQVRPRDASAAGRLAMALHAQEQFQTANTAYRRARHLDPHSFEWAYLGAVVEAKLGDFAGAIKSLRQALTLESTYLPARVALADTLVQLASWKRHARSTSPFFGTTRSSPSRTMAAAG